MGSVSENSHNSKPSSITSHDDDDDDGDFMASFRNLGLENSNNSKPSSITSQDDDGDLMASLRNLGFIEFPGTSLSNNFGVGSTSFSVSSEQGSQKEEISYGGQINGALGKRPAISCVSETSYESPNSMPSLITSHDDDGDFMSSLQNLGFIEFPETSLSYNFEVGSTSFSVSSEQGSQKEEISYGGPINGALGKRPVNSCVSETSSESPIRQGTYLPSDLHSRPTNNTSNDLVNDLVTSPRTPLKNYSSNGSPSTCAKTPACAPNFSNQLRGTSLRDDQARIYNWGMGYNMSNGYNLYPTNWVSVGNGYNLHTNGGKCGGSVLDCLPEGVDMVMMAKTRNCSQILHRLLGAEDKETRGKIFVEVFEKIPELMIDPNGHHVFQKIFELMIDPNGHYVFQKLFNSCNDNEFQIILMKLTSENRFLIGAAFDGHGSFSIQKFIKRLKKSPMASTVTSILSTSFFEMMTHRTAQHVIYECLNLMGVQPNKNTQKAKSRVRPSDDDGLDLLDLEQYGFFETSLEMTTSANNYPSSSAQYESDDDDDGLDLLDLEQYGFIETSPEMSLEQYGFFEISLETTTSAANPSSSAQFESDDGTTKVPLNLISSNNTRTESIPDSSPENLMGSTNYIMCLNKDCYKCWSFMDTSHSCNLGIGSFILNGGESKEASTSGTEICKSGDS